MTDHTPTRIGLTPTQLRHALSAKQSRAERGADGIWRIRRHDGALVGSFSTRKLAEQRIVSAPYLR